MILDARKTPTQHHYNSYKIIQNLNDGGQTILLVEENVSRAIAISDHIYLLDDGHIAWQGTGEELAGERHLMEVYLGA